MGDTALNVAARYRALRAAIDEEVRSCGRDPGAVTLVGIGKGQPSAVLAAAVNAGLSDLGERYLQEARHKLSAIPPVRKHFVGHVQTNKAKAIAAGFDMVQSVDRERAGIALSRAALELGTTLPVLLQLNISPVERYGCPPEEAQQLA